MLSVRARGTESARWVAGLRLLTARELWVRVWVTAFDEKIGIARDEGSQRPSGWFTEQVILRVHGP